MNRQWEAVKSVNTPFTINYQPKPLIIMTNRSYTRPLILIHLFDIKKYEEGVRKGDDPEDLHELRISVRRLRNALWVCADLIPEEKCSKWNKGLRKLTRATSQARDLDVFMEFLAEQKKEIKDKGMKYGIEAYIKELTGIRKSKMTAIVKRLDKLYTRHIPQNIEKLFKNKKISQKLNARDKICVRARRSILLRLDELLVIEPYIYHEHNARELHEVRIALRHLRYTLELFTGLFFTKDIKEASIRSFFSKRKGSIDCHSVFGRRKVNKGMVTAGFEKFIEDVIHLQRALGQLHDYDVWLTEIPELMDKKRNSDQFFMEKKLKTLRKESYWKLIKTWEVYQRRKFWGKLRGLIST